MISVKEAREILSNHLPDPVHHYCSLSDANNRVLAEDISSPIDVPSFDNSAMDGYAFRFSPDRNHFPLSATVRAGDFPEERAGEGEAVRIFTGAAVPAGADTVIPQELVRKNEDGSIEFDLKSIAKGANIRKQGTQTRKGEVLLQRGSVLNPGSIGLLASVGIDKVKIFKPPSVGIIVTGSEIIPTGAELRPGQVFDSNSPLLISALANLGIDAGMVIRVGDDRELLEQNISDCLENCDILLLTGGISVGDYDFVYNCLESNGVSKLFYKVKQRPGKPLFAGKKGDKMIFGLPGNPGSVASCYVQYARPVARHMLGFKDIWEPGAVLPLDSDFTKKPGLTFFIKVEVSDLRAKVLSGQQSFNMRPFNRANAFAELDESAREVKAETRVKIYPW